MNSNNTIWVILTDGNFIKVMFNSAGMTGLRTLRDDDFEQTSEIAYKLVIGKRIRQLSTPLQQEEQYFLQLLTDFLLKQYAKSAFNALVFIAPNPLLDKIKQHLPAEITARIKASIAGDYLNLSMDKLEEQLRDVIGG
jgi:protein required for attachment to host cells